MLVDAQGQFLTQREHAIMAQFACTIEHDHLSITYKGEVMKVPLQQHLSESTRVKVWSSSLKANEVDPLISSWFSEHLGMHSTLVKMTDISSRYKRLFVPPFKTELSFADGYPYLILGSESMEELNRRSEEPIPTDRFRANILVDTTEPHEEDKWKSDFKIGTSRMKVIKPCARCVVTTIDQQSGAKSKEPLKTLSNYRKWSKKIWFGANAICLEEGLISVGDEIQLI